MMLKVKNSDFDTYNRSVDGMFRDRKRIFVDLLKWDVPVVGDWECDQFDNEFAEYFIVCDPVSGDHWGSMRVLCTDRPHILNTLFPMLCEGAVPSGPDVRELTRLCLSPSLRARQRLQVRNRLFSGLVEHALECGIRAFTGIAEMSWYAQLLSLGWRTQPLGLPQEHNGEVIAAAVAFIDGDTIRLFSEAGVYVPGDRMLPGQLPIAA